MTLSRRTLFRRGLLATPVLSGTALFGVSGLVASSEAMDSAVHAQDSATNPGNAPTVIVRAGETRAGQPWTIGGVPHIWTKISGKDVAGRLAVLELTTPAGAGPPMHIHKSQNESMYLLEGAFGLQYGSERTVLHKGDFFMVPAGVPHAYVVLGEKPARHLNLYDPAVEIEAFFENFDRDHARGNLQDPAHAAELERKYQTRVVGPPLKTLSFAT